MPLRIFELPSFDGHPRPIRVYTPEAYDQPPHDRFGVVYLQDGQNMFAHPSSARAESWAADQALERLVQGGQLAPWILVGVDHAVDRLGEYSGWDFPRAGTRAKGEQYTRWLSETVKPLIDREYRTRPEARFTATLGSSMGGLVSLLLGLWRPDTFGRIGAFSPTVMWSDEQLFSAWSRHSGCWTRIYLDAGLHETLDIDGVHLDYGRDTRRFHEHLRSVGYGDHELMLVLEPMGQHSEVDWRRRLPFALRWLLC